MQHRWQILYQIGKIHVKKLEKYRPHSNLVSKGCEWVSDWHGFTMIGPESDKNWNIRNCNVADILFSAIYLGVREKIKTWTMFIYVSGCGSISVLRTCQSKDLVWSLYLSTIRTSLSNNSEIKDDKDVSVTKSGWQQWTCGAILCKPPGEKTASKRSTQL